MQLNMSEYDDDMGFDIEEMNSLANSINSFQNGNGNGNVRRGNIEPENNIRITPKKKISFEDSVMNDTSKNSKQNVGPTPRQTTKQPIANPIADYIQKMLAKKEQEVRAPFQKQERQERQERQEPQRQERQEPQRQERQEPQRQINTPSSVKATRMSTPIIDNKPVIEDLQKPRLTFDDILAKMNITVKNGTLHHLNDTVQAPQQNSNPNVKHVPLKPEITKENSYIYNKYFKDYMKEDKEQTILVPKTKEEYKRMLINQILDREIHRRKINQIKPKTMALNTQNIQISHRFGAVPNKLFGFSR